MMLKSVYFIRLIPDEHDRHWRLHSIHANLQAHESYPSVKLEGTPIVP